MAGLFALALVADGGVFDQRGAAALPEPRAAATESAEEAAPKGVFRTPDGEIAIHLQDSTQRLIGLRTQEIASTTLQPEVAAYGVLEEDPSHTFTVRTPIAGVLQPPEGAPWPSLGMELLDGAVVGAIEPRVVPVERIDLVSRLATARADIASITASLAAARANFERTKRLNADGKIVSDKVLQEVEAQVTTEQARLRSASESEKLVAEALAALAGPTGPRPLRVDRGGTVIDIVAQAGEAVEAGQPLLRVARFDTILAKVVVPSAAPVSANGAARVIVIGHDDRPLAGDIVAVIAVDPKTQGQSFLIRLHAAQFPLRPGQAVTAYLAASGAPLSGVVIPRSAVVRYAGKAWVYVKAEGETFVQREVPTNRSVHEGWFVTDGFKGGEQVVTVAAETVLSEALKAQIPSPEEGESEEHEEHEEREH